MRQRILNARGRSGDADGGEPPPPPPPPPSACPADILSCALTYTVTTDAYGAIVTDRLAHTWVGDDGSGPEPATVEIYCDDAGASGAGWYMFIYKSLDSSDTVFFSGFPAALPNCPSTNVADWAKVSELTPGFLELVSIA